VTGIANVIQISAGGSHICALVRAGSVWCWGDNSLGQVGSGFAGGTFETPRQVPDLYEVVEISSGEFSTCARDERGSVRCWGSASSGQLGDSLAAGAHADCANRTIPCSAKPVAVAGLLDAVALAGGLNFNCAERRTGSPVCWGWNFGLDRTYPVPTHFAAGTSIGTGYEQICGVSEGLVRCTTDAFEGPVVLRPGVGPVKFALGGWDFMCGLRVDGQVACWSKVEDSTPTIVHL
jgi:Regulator of chromosome condensation (RCC1) repeat